MFSDRQIKILEENRHMRDRIDIHRNTDASCFDSVWQIANICQEVTNRPVDLSCPNCIIENVLWVYKQLDKHYQDEKDKIQTLEILKKTSLSALTDEDLLEIHLEESKKVAEAEPIKRKRGQRGKNRI